MKISLLAVNLSANSLGRVYLLAKLLEPYYEIEIIGSMFGAGIWPPCNTNEFTYKSFPGTNYPHYAWTIRELAKAISGDVVYACKVFPGTLGVALLSKYFAHRPIILDIDDWDSAAIKGRGVHPIRYDLHRISHPNSYFHTLALERFTRFADSITVSSAFLASKFGGTIVPHARDTDFLDPANFQRSELRERWGIGRTKLILFLGTVRPHKGVEDLIQAVRLLKRDDVTLWLVGADMDSPYVNELMMQGQDVVKVLGYQPFTEIPKFLSIADLVVVPQRKTPFAMAQVPAKIFDAMAMAKPVIGTDVSDIPQILDGCGWVVPSGDVEALAKSISYVLDNCATAEEMGQKARLKCQRLYSWDTAREILRQVMRKYE